MIFFWVLIVVLVVALAWNVRLFLIIKDPIRWVAVLGILAALFGIFYLGLVVFS